MSNETTTNSATVSTGAEGVSGTEQVSKGVSTPTNKAAASETQQAAPQRAPSLNDLLDTHLGVDSSQNHKGL